MKMALEEVEAAKNIRSFALYNIAAFIIEVIATVFSAGLFFTALTGGGRMVPSPGFPAPYVPLLGLSGLIGSVALLVMAIIIGLISIYYLIKGLGGYCAIDDVFCTPHKLTKYGLMGGLVLMLMALLIVLGGLTSSGGNPMSALTVIGAGGVVLLVGLVLLVIGGIASLIGLWRFGSLYGNVLVKASVILYIVGALFSAKHWIGGLLSIMALVLLYMGSTEIYRNLT